MPRVWTRRLAVFGGAAAIVAGFQNAARFWDWWDDGFSFEPIADPQGFRRITGNGVGDASLAGLFAGIGDPDPQTVLDDSIIRDNLCAILFNEGPGVPVAVFSDYYCPYCRVLDVVLYKLSDEGLITLRQHETPIFGAGSEWAARAAIAARAQGQGRAYFERLSGTPIRANPAFLRQVADEIGVDPVLFAADMVSDNTNAVLREATGLQRIFGFIGTPALVVGRTVLQGAISETNLRQLIDLERDQASDHPCA